MTTPMSESDVLSYWEKHQVYKKIKKNNSQGDPFYFMDGPPYATGHIHMGTALNKVLKDVAMRSQRMQGKDVFDRPGYDTHGLPIEWQVEKEIGSKSKKDIEKYGVGKFVEKCREYATKYIGVMNDEFKDLGIWMDWENPYMTLSNEYIESIWDVLKKAYEKNLLYLGAYPIHVCPRCATAVAFNEIEYGVQKDRAIYVKFPVTGKKNTFLLIWTTTPWTLPANTGVMAHPDFVYSEISLSNGEHWILAKDLVSQRLEEFGIGYKHVKDWKGSELKGWKYENPVSKHTKIKVKDAHVVMAPRYVSISDGSGLVHCAPGHGKEDYDVGNQNGLEKLCPVGIDGILTEEAGKYAGKKAREVDAEIIEDLKHEGFIAYDHIYSHDYPLCWRCKTPLLMVSLPQWFLRISEIHSKILKENEEVKWVPKWAQARMKAWLEGISDWPISRERYWGTPLPIWQCSSCKKQEVIGSISELEKKSKAKIGDLHKPGIDKIGWNCRCGGEMQRVNSVFDVWFDSGASSWAALGYPANKDNFKRYWPANLNIEGPDQIRGWWNSQLILSIIGFDRKPFENISVHGMVLDINKRKMSKSLGNVVSPHDIIAKYGRDYLRYYLVKLSRGEDFAYNEREFVDIRKFFGTLSNLGTFLRQIEPGQHNTEIEDKWIVSRYNTTVSKVREAYNEFKFYAALDYMEKFVIEDLSRTYIQMIRDRSDEVSEIVREIYKGILQLLAPVVPFMTEKLWLEINAGESIHLSKLPETQENNRDEDLEKGFNNLKEILETGLAERDKLKIGLKWPLASVKIKSPVLARGMSKIIERQLNVKRVIASEGNLEVSYDTKMTPELEGEGFAREVTRRVQAERKNRGMNKSQTIRLSLVVSAKLKKLLLNHTKFIANKTGSEEITVNTDGKFDVEFNVKEEKIGIFF